MIFASFILKMAMKTQSLVRPILIILTLAAVPYFAIGQNKQSVKREVIREKINAQRFTFSAQNVIPMHGRSRNVSTDNYTLQITPDSVIAYLPYFGRAYVAPMNPSQGGIQFTSVKFQYSKTPAKKGGWNIVIKPDDVRDTRQLSLSVSSEGYASLQVISNTRDPISFNGVIVEK